MKVTCFWVSNVQLRRTIVNTTCRTKYCWEKKGKCVGFRAYRRSLFTMVLRDSQLSNMVGFPTSSKAFFTRLGPIHTAGTGVSTPWGAGGRDAHAPHGRGGNHHRSPSTSAPRDTQSWLVHCCLCCANFFRGVVRTIPRLPRRSDRCIVVATGLVRTAVVPPSTLGFRGGTTTINTMDEPTARGQQPSSQTGGGGVLVRTTHLKPLAEHYRSVCPPPQQCVSRGAGGRPRRGVGGFGV